MSILFKLPYTTILVELALNLQVLWTLGLHLQMPILRLFSLLLFNRNILNITKTLTLAEIVHYN